MTALTAQDEGTSVDAKVGANVHSLLWNRRIQQKTLAGQMGLTESVLSKKLRGLSGWSATQVQIAADFFEIDPGRLYQLPSQPKVQPQLTLITGEGRTSYPTTPMLTTVTTSD